MPKTVIEFDVRAVTEEINGLVASGFQLDCATRFVLLGWAVNTVDDFDEAGLIAATFFAFVNQSLSELEGHLRAVDESHGEEAEPEEALENGQDGVSDSVETVAEADAVEAVEVVVADGAGDVPAVDSEETRTPEEGGIDEVPAVLPIEEPKNPNIQSVTAQERERVQEMWKTGDSIEQIAVELNRKFLSISQLTRHLVPRDLEKTEGRDVRLWTTAEDKRVTDFYSQGIAIPVQATLLGRGQTAVKARRRFLGLSKPSDVVSAGVQKTNEARSYPAMCEVCKVTFQTTTKSWQKKVCPLCEKRQERAAAPISNDSGQPVA